MLNKLTLIYFVFVCIAILVRANTNQHRANDWSNTPATQQSVSLQQLTSTSSILLTNSHKHHASKHRLNNSKNHRKKSSNRHRSVVVHKTTTVPITTTLSLNSFENDEETSELRRFNLPEHVNVTVKVGDSIILNCAINSSYGASPGVIWMQGKLGNVLTLDTNRITLDTRFEIIQLPLHQTNQNELLLNNGSNSNKRSSNHLYHQHHYYEQRHHNYRQVQQTDFNYYHLKINNVQIDDENEYACETSKQSDDQPNVHALFNVHITQSPSFIEQLTSETNNAIFEFSDTVLKCFATGKPAPKIKWYQISDENEILKDLFHESSILSLKNVSKYDPGKYECVASNGILPSVSKRFSITVYYSPTVIALNQIIYQTVGQSVLLGCIVNSNPESTVVWYRRNKNLTNGTLNTNYDEFELIDINQSRFQIHKFKQTNQTVYYFKIKYLEASDYTQFKCEATNLVGKSEAVIEVLDLEDSDQYGTSSSQNSEKSIKKNQSISYVINNAPQGDQVDEQDENGAHREANSKNDDTESDEFRSTMMEDDYKPNQKDAWPKKKQPALGMRKNTNNNSNNSNNRTLHKYQINKSNSILQETENSLQRINDILENGSASYNSFHSIYLSLLLILNFIYIFL